MQSQRNRGGPSDRSKDGLRERDLNDGFDPTKPIPRPRQQPGGKAPRNPNAGGAKDARKSRVGDKIKKRMSMRYADISQPSLLGGQPERIPVVPVLRDTGEGIAGVGIRRDRDEADLYTTGPVEDQDTEVRQDPRSIDLNVLQQPDFDPDAYLKIKLANSTEAELKSLRSTLEASKAATAADLQRNVFKNYAEFVLISKEISTLENDMSELKESLSEWRSMPSLLNIDADTSTSVADRRRTNRSSIADLRTLYASQLQELHSQIEGSSKFVPAIPGRHIISEFGDLWALNSATYKVDHAVHVVLLDDSLLVAKKRKRRTGGGGRLVAERCWPLADIVLVDVKDTVDLTNVIKVRRSKETHVFRTDMLSDKKALLSTFRQVAEELATKKRKEREGEHERRRSVWTGERNSLAVGPAPVPALPAWLLDLQGKGLGPVGPVGGAKEKEENEARKLNDYADKLAVTIALREWDEAVKMIEQGNSFSPPNTSPTSTATAPLPPKLEALKETLVSDLLHALSDPTHKKQAVTRLVSYLTRLGAALAARDAFLATRAELIKKRARAIRFEGDISLYISELALVTFMMIKHTSEWYLASFKEHDMASGMVQWAKEQIEIYAKMFQRQVNGPDTDPQTVQTSIQVTKLQSKRLLQDNGLDFSHLLDNLLGVKHESNQKELERSTSTSTLGLNRSLRQPRTPAQPPTRAYSPAPGPPPQRSRDRPTSTIIQYPQHQAP